MNAPDIIGTLGAAIDQAAAAVIDLGHARPAVAELADGILAPIGEDTREAALRHLVTEKLTELLSLTADCDADTFLLDYDQPSTGRAVSAAVGPVLDAMNEQDRQSSVLRELLIGEILATRDYLREQREALSLQDAR